MNDLDNKLKDWGAQATPNSPLSDEAFAANMVEKLRNLPPHTATPPPRKPIPFRAILALAAMIAVVATATVLLKSPSVEQPPTETAQAYNGLSKADLAEVRIVADEINDLFPDGVRWISKVNGELNLSPGEQQSIASLDQRAPRVLVALSVMVQENGQWTEASRHDVIAAADEPVEINGATPASVWCHLVDEKMAAINTQVQLNISGGKLSITTNAMQSIGTPSLVHTAKTDDGKPIKVYQTVYTI